MLGRGGDAQRVRLLAAVADLFEPLVGRLREAQRAFGIAFLERDACAQDVDDRAHARVTCERGAFAATVDRLASGGHVAVFELHGRERLHDGELDRGVGHALEESSAR